MIIEKDNVKELIDICYSYYKFNKTQLEIAQMLNISRAKVSNLLASARKNGIVKIIINDPFKKIEQLEKGLIKKYKLKNVKILAIPKSSVIDHKKEIGKIAANYFTKIIRNGDKIAISGGSSIWETIKSIDNSNFYNIIVAPLFGVFLPVFQPDKENLYSYEITWSLAKKLNAKVANISVPGKVGDSKIYELLISNQTVKKGLEIAENCSVALVGIGGAYPSSTVFRKGVFTESNYNELKKENAVGDIGLNYFKKNGEPCKKFNSKIIGVKLDKIKKIPLVIGVAGGMEKLDAIKGALNGDYLDVLITDQNVAEELLNSD